MSEKKEQAGNSRRDFIKTGAVAAAGVTLAGNIPMFSRAYAGGDDTIKVALIGAGGRGSGAVSDCVKAGGNVKITALADAFEPNAQAAAKNLSKTFTDKVDLPGDKVFVGLDAYQRAIDSGVDMVILAGPPGFRPQHYEAAVRAGKHVFMEKPVCVCPGGFRKVMAANKLAEEKNLKVSVGLQRHHEAGYLGTMQAIADGKFGDISLIRAYWNGDGIWNRTRKQGMTEMQYQIHNWYHFAWLSGDNICEQHIHNLDIGNWIMSAWLKKEGPDWAHPVEANGMGASLTRGYNGKDIQGQIFDAHFVEFAYENGVRMISECRHQPGTWSQVDEYFHSTKKPEGVRVNGAAPAPEVAFKNPYQQEHFDLQKVVKEDKKHHEGWFGAISSMTSVLGRAASYSGKVVKWKELVENGEDTFAKNLSWDATPPVAPDPNGFYPVPMPGKWSPYSPAYNATKKRG